MPRLLLVEDNQHMQRIFHDKLQREGFTIITADDGAAGLQRAQETHPDAILLDIMLPKMDGFEVLTHLREDPTLSNTPVFMLSNRSTSNDIQHATALGARHFFAKGTSKLQDVAQQIRTTCGFKKVIVYSRIDTAAAITRTITHSHVLTAVVSVAVEVVSTAERSTPDLIILDGRAANAFTLLQQLKNSATTRNIPLIAIRDHSQQQHRLDEFIDSDKITTDLRPLVLKRLSLEDVAPTVA